jgi:hydroxymethylbilane synthase
VSEAPALRLGTRGSALALAQAELVAKALGGAEPVPIRTAGDERPDGSPPEAAAGPGGDKARFVVAIERALLAGEVELAVHSAKDLPTELPDGLEIAGVPEREDPRDAYVGTGTSLGELSEGARVATSSLRRRAQLLAARPDLRIEPIRGNVDTRLRKLAEGDLDGIVLAAAGLRRLGRESEIAFTFEAGVMTPAAGQGAIAIEARTDDPAEARAQVITDRRALAEVSAERAAVAALGASCDTPVGAHAEIGSGRMTLRGFCGLPDGSEWVRDEVTDDASEPERLGRSLAERMRAAGAAELLERAEQMAAGKAAGR